MLNYPTFDSTQKQQILSLISAYKQYAINNKIVYNYTLIRNAYVDNSCFDNNNRVKMNCGLFCQLIWMGVNPDSFFVDNYSGNIIKSFDWGYNFQFPNRAKAFGVKRSDGKYYNFVKPNATNYEGSYSDNSFYSPNAQNNYKQTFCSYANAADMANELYLMGCEIPIREIDVGDLIFYEANHQHDKNSDEYEQTAFRRINHAAIVIGKGKNDYLQIAECTSSSGKPIVYRSLGYSYNEDRVRMANLNNRIVMVARHPHIMLDKVGNVGNKFETLATP